MPVKPFKKDALMLRVDVYLTIAKSSKNPINFDLIMNKFRSPGRENMHRELITSALSDLQAVLKHFPDKETTPKALYKMAQIFDEQDSTHLMSAIELYEKIIQNHPDSNERDLAAKRLEEIRASSLEETPRSLPK